MTELKKALQSKILEFEALKNHPQYNSEIEQNAVTVVLRELKYLDSITELEQSHIQVVMQAEGSDGAKGATVGQRSGGTVAEAWVATPKPKAPLSERLEKLSKKIRARSSREEQP